MKIYSACMDESISADAKSKNPCIRLCVHMRRCKKSIGKVQIFGDSSFLVGAKKVAVELQTLAFLNISDSSKPCGKVKFKRLIVIYGKR